ncbi:MAG: isochorismatase family cysteine hydrolase [Candidatus Aenigmatarchaeota archaeon]
MKEALLVIDVQKIYTESDSNLCCVGNDKTIENINKLIDNFTKRNELIIMVRHMHKKDGSDLGRMFDFAGESEDFNFKEDSNEVKYAENLKRPKNVIEITKNRYSAFKNTDLDRILKKHKVKKVVICGFMTNFCCESTAREAHDMDYFVDFIIDATGCPDLPSLTQNQIKKVVSETLANGWAVMLTTDEYIKQKRGEACH